MIRALLVREQRERAAPLLYFYSSVFWLVIGMAAGTMLAFTAVNPFLLEGTPLYPLITYGRLQPVFVNTLVFGWLSMAFIGLALYITPRLTKAPLRHEGLAKGAAWLQNLVVAAGALSLMGGFTTGWEYGEYIAPLGWLWLLALLAVGYVLLANLREREKPELDVPLWHFAGAVVWMILLQLVAYGLRGAGTGFGDALLSWFHGHGLFGLWLGMMGLGVVYYLAPRLAGRPLFSSCLAALGFWGVAALYPVTGPHLMAEPVPLWMQRSAMALGLIMLLPMWAVLTNLFRTVEGRWGRLWSTPAGRFLAAGMVFYMAFWLKGIVQLIPAVSATMQFTYWAAAYDYVALLGAFGFVAMAGIYEGAPRLLGKTWYSESLASLHFWLTAVGVVLMGVALARAGMLQGAAWAAGTSFESTVAATQPHLVTHAWAVLLVIAAQLSFAYNVFKTATSAGSAAPAPDVPGVRGEAT